MRRSDRPHRGAGSTGARRALVAYIAAWLIGAAIVAIVVIVLLGGGDDETVQLPPVHQTELDSAARLAGCDLRRTRGDELVNPPVEGAGGVATARPGFYEEQPEIDSLTAALRRGIVVIHFRSGLDESRVDELRTIQEAVPTGTIVTQNATGMGYEVAATAYRRLLGCRRFTDAASEAIRLFHGRWLGSGPDS